jgi:hypothetical protein
VIQQQQSRAQRHVLRYLLEHGPTSHTALTVELIRMGLGDSLRLSALMIGLRDHGWVLVDTDGLIPSSPTWKTPSYALTRAGCQAATGAP